jgi:fatty-acid desaturase
MVEIISGIDDRIDITATGSPLEGDVRWSPVKSIWWSGMACGWAVLGTLYFSWTAVAVFILLCGVTLCLGHSLGMHRKLIHGSFESPDWVEKLLVYCGTLVGLGGPFTMMQTHDLRDWAQRQPTCHDYLAHQRDFLTDFWWQLHCKLNLAHPPAYKFPEKLTGSPYYRILQAISMVQQLPLALLLLALGGWGWVAWGVCGRVTVSIFGHWIIGYFAHNHGQRDWHVAGAAVQGHNVRFVSLITFGECWHNNHHAFPGSAKLGLNPDQLDPGWLVLTLLERLGLAWRLKQPEDLVARKELVRIPESHTVNA